MTGMQIGPFTDVTTRITVVATKRCDVDCPMCYVPIEQRKNSYCLSEQILETIVSEARGFHELQLFNGDFRGAFESIVRPCLHLCNANGIKSLVITTSGIYFTSDDLVRIREMFDGHLTFDLSIDGNWGHRNHCEEARYGDVLGRFLAFSAANPADTEVCVYWTQVRGETARNERDKCEQRCTANNVHFVSAMMVDGTNDIPTFGPTVNPYRLGLHNERIDNWIFATCAIPNLKHGRRVLQVRSGISGTYNLCYDSTIGLLKLGDIGGVGVGGLLAEVQSFFAKRPHFSLAVRDNGMLGVLGKLLDRCDTRDEAAKLLDGSFPATCGMCSICRQLGHLLDRFGPE
jgi:hypothetical protein